jgi:type II secretory pathway component PulF
MPEYAFEALTRGGTTERGRLAAADEAELAERLRGEGSFLVHAEVASRAPPAGRRLKDAKLGREDLVAFTEYLAGSAQVGIPLLTSLRDMQRRLESKRLRAITGQVIESMSEYGASLADALSEHPKAFSKLYVGTVAAGQASGHLDYALRQLADYLDWQREITVQVRQALLYPIILVLVVIGLMSTLVMFVYPRILPVVTGYGVELPLATRVVSGTADFLNAYWPLVLGGAGAVVGLVVLIRRSRRGRLALDTFALRLPIFGPLLRRINMARVVTYFSLFYRTGVELILSLTLVEEMLENRRVSSAVATVRERVVHGEAMATAFAADPIFPPEVVRAVALGEATGTLDEALGRVRIYYAREVPAAVKRMLTALQPLLIIGLGALILFVALSIIMPIVSIYENLGSGR